jgi:class 3 adenylate cyclase
LDEAGTLERVKAHRIELAEPLIAEHHGRVVKLTGDGALVEFASAVDASNARSRFSAAWPSGRRPSQRIGASASASASVKRHREVTPWRHEELTPCGCWCRERLVQVVHGRAPPAARPQARAVGRREGPGDPPGQAGGLMRSAPARVARPPA